MSPTPTNAPTAKVRESTSTASIAASVKERVCAMSSEPRKLFPGGAPDAETHELMARLSDLQMWCVLMSQKDSGGVAAARLIQDTRAFIVERVFHGARHAG